MTTPRKQIPKITVGKYAGTPIDQLPNGYLRWMIGQKFPLEWIEIAKKKIEESDWDNEPIHVTRHAIDMFSKRFLTRWVNGNRGDGIATFIAKLAQEAWEQGADVSKRRHQDDGLVKLYDEIKWVFSINPNFPEYREVITVMPLSEK